MVRIRRDARQPFVGIACLQDPHGLVAAGLRQRPVERHEFMPELAGILVDGSEDGRMLGKAEIGLIERDLRCIDWLRDRDTALDDIPPVLGVRGLALPQRRNCESVGRRDNDAVDVPAHAAVGDGEPELVTVAIAGAQVVSGLDQPVDGKVLEDMADRKNAQRLAGELFSGVARGLQELILQLAGAAFAKATAAQIGTGFTLGR